MYSSFANLRKIRASNNISLTIRGTPLLLFPCAVMKGIIELSSVYIPEVHIRELCAFPNLETLTSFTQNSAQRYSGEPINIRILLQEFTPRRSSCGEGYLWIDVTLQDGALSNLLSLLIKFRGTNYIQKHIDSRHMSYQTCKTSVTQKIKVLDNLLIYCNRIIYYRSMCQLGEWDDMRFKIEINISR